MQFDAGAYSFVMATGILSVASALEGLDALSRVLFALAAAAYLLLAAVLRTGAVREPSFGPYAFVAATGVLGARLAVGDRVDAAFALWALALAAWLVVSARRPPAATPSILLAVVGTEALAVLGAAVARGEAMRPLLFAALALWALGLLLYPVVVTVLARRRPPFEPELWVLMGALAIATLAASQLAAGARALDALRGTRPFVEDAGLATWATATALIPILAAADLARRAGWRYATGRWSFVFPLGMYATSSQTLGNAVAWHPLVGIGRAFLAAAVGAWAVVAAGLIRQSRTAVQRFLR